MPNDETWSNIFLAAISMAEVTKSYQLNNITLLLLATKLLPLQVSKVSYPTVLDEYTTVIYSSVEIILII